MWRVSDTFSDTTLNHRKDFAVRLLSIIVILASAFTAVAQEDVSRHLQEVSVTIKAGGSEGSGITFSRDGQTFIWTAGHVVDGLRRTRSVIDPKSGTNRTIVEF